MNTTLLLVEPNHSTSAVFKRQYTPPELKEIGEMDLPAAALPQTNDYLKHPDGTTYVVVRREYWGGPHIRLHVAIWEQGFHLPDYL